MDSKRTGYVFQQVEPFNVFQEAPDASSEAWLTRDVTRYLVQGYFGSGIVDDRPLFMSDTTIDSTSKMPVDSREYTCCTEAWSSVKAPEMAKKLPWSTDRTVFTVK